MHLDVDWLTLCASGFQTLFALGLLANEEHCSFLEIDFVWRAVDTSKDYTRKVDSATAKAELSFKVI